MTTYSELQRLQRILDMVKRQGFTIEPHRDGHLYLHPVKSKWPHYADTASFHVGATYEEVDIWLNGFAAAHIYHTIGTPKKTKKAKETKK